MGIKKLTLSDVNKILPNWRLYNLSPRQARFLTYYVTNGYNRVEAYKNAGYKSKRKEIIKAESARLLKHPSCKKLLDEHMDNFLMEKTQMCVDLVNQYHTMATFDPAEILDEAGELKGSLEDLPLDVRKCIASIETKHYGNKGQHTKTTIKFHDRMKAMDKLAEYASLVKSSAEQSVSLSPETVNMLSSVFKGKGTEKN